VSATPAQHSEIEELLTRLESAGEGPHRPLRSFPIRNRPVEELQELLEGMLAKGVLKGSPDVQKAKSGVVEDKVVQGVTAPIPALSAPPSIATDKLGDEVILTADRSTNRLLAMGNARVLEQLEALIRELDQRSPQVLVEAMVVTLSDTQTRELGVEISKLGTAGDTQWRLSSLFGLGSPNPAAPTLPAPGGTGFSGVVLDPGSFSALVKALETANHGRTRTMPRLLVGNHQAGRAELGAADALREHQRLEHGRDDQLRRHAGRRHADLGHAADRRGRPDPARLHDQPLVLRRQPIEPKPPAAQAGKQAQEHGHRAGWIHGRGWGARDPERERRPHQDAALR
jgi:hypothetical protein